MKKNETKKVLIEVEVKSESAGQYLVDVINNEYFPNKARLISPDKGAKLIDKQEKSGCVAGCKRLTGHETWHHKDCQFYPESLSKMYDDLKNQSFNKDGLKDKIIGKSFGWNGNVDKSAIYLKDLFHIIDTMPDPKDLLIIASFDKQGLKDKIKCTVCNGDGYTAEHVCDGTESMCSSSCPQQFQCEACRATGINLSLNIMQIIDTLEPKVLSEEAHYKELYEQGLQIIDALNKLIDNTKVPSEDEIMKKVLLFFEREKYFFDNKLTEKDSTAVLNELDRLRDEIISYMKGEQK